MEKRSRDGNDMVVAALLLLLLAHALVARFHAPPSTLPLASPCRLMLCVLCYVVHLSAPLPPPPTSSCRRMLDGWRFPRPSISRHIAWSVASGQAGTEPAHCMLTCHALPLQAPLLLLNQPINELSE